MRLTPLSTSMEWLNKDNSEGSVVILPVAKPCLLRFIFINGDDILDIIMQTLKTGVQKRLIILYGDDINLLEGEDPHFLILYNFIPVRINAPYGKSP